MTTKELFFKLLSYPSITPDDAGAFTFIQEYLDDFEAVRIDVEDTKNLLLYKRFSEGPHLSFAGHIDVVPAGPGWESDPFVPTEKNGFVYARGTQDMKSGVCAFVQACKELETFNGTLSLLLTSDEEGDAKHGTIEILKYLKEKDFLPDFAVVAEPTCEEIFGDAMKVGRRGSINGVLELQGRQGHAAYPEKAINTVHLMASRLDALAAHRFDDGDDVFAPSQLVITDIRSGLEVTNVSPGYLKLMFNVRNSTKTTKEDIAAYVEQVMHGLDFKLSLFQGAKPFVTDATSPVVVKLAQAIERVTGLTPKNSTAGGTSDARFLAEYGIKAIEFGVKNDTIHAPNERTTMREVEDLYHVFKELLRLF